MRSIFEVIDKSRIEIGESWERIWDPNQKKSSRDLANVLSIPTTLAILFVGIMILGMMPDYIRGAKFQRDVDAQFRSRMQYEALHRQEEMPFVTSNAPRPPPRPDSMQWVPTAPLLRRSREAVATDLALTIEASASRRNLPCGSWTLVSLNRRLVSLAVELHAVSVGASPAEHQQLLIDAQRKLGQSGVRTFFARVEPDQQDCPTPGAALVRLQNQRGEWGHLVEATPSLRDGSFAHTEIGIFSLQDVVSETDASYSVIFRRPERHEDNVTYASQNTVYFTFDATLGRVLLSLNSIIPRSENPYVLPPTVSPRVLLPLDSNSDGFTVQDAVAVFGSVIGAISTIVDIAGLAISAGELVATLAPLLLL